MIDDQEFRLRADEALGDLYDALVEASEKHGFETDYGSSVTVEFDDPPAKFVVSPNAPVKQIWISANVKSFKLDWVPAQSAFVLPATGETLKQVVAANIAQHLGEEVAL